MPTVMNAIKFVGCWTCIVLVALTIAHVIVAPAEILAILAIGFAQAPSAI